MVVLAPQTAMAQDPDAGPNPHHIAARIITAELSMQDAASRLSALAAEKPAGVADSIRHQLAVAAATYQFRQAARQEQTYVYAVAGYGSVEAAVLPLLPSTVRSSFGDSISALHSLYNLAGIDEIGRAHV